MSQHERENEHGGTEFMDADGYWMDERNVCHHCQDDCKSKGKPYKWADEQYSFGIYAGRYCDECWKESGYRDATDPNAAFDPADAGERIDDDY